MSYGIFRHRPRIVPRTSHHVYYFSPTKNLVVFAKRASASINHFISLNPGDKIKIVARTFNGTSVRTSPGSVRFRIRKRI